MLIGRRALRPLPVRDWPVLMALAALGLTLTQLLQAWALERSGSAKTAWLIAINPVVTAALAVPLLGERLRGKIAGLGLASAGALLVTGEGRALRDVMALPSTRGDALTFALYTVWGRRHAVRGDAQVVAFHLLVFAALMYLPGFVTARGWAELHALGETGWLALVYLGVGCSGVAFLLYYAALEHLEAGRAAAFIYVEPLIAQLLGVGFMAEPLSVPVLVGGAAILAGVYLVSRAPAVAVPA